MQMMPKDLSSYGLQCVVFMLTLFLTACTSTGPVSKSTSSVAEDRVAERPGSARKSPSSVKMEAIGESGFTLSEAVRVNADVRRDYQRAVALLRSEQLDAGVQLLESIVERAPDVTNPHIDLGIAYQRLDKLAESEASLRRALELAPDHPAALNELGILQRRIGQFADARRSYEQALAIYPGFHFALLNLGMLCDIYLDDLACAHQNYTLYQTIVPNDPSVRIWIADVESRMAAGG